MALKKNAVIVGGGISKFGVRAATFFDMLQEATSEVARDIPELKSSRRCTRCLSLSPCRQKNPFPPFPQDQHRLAHTPRQGCYSTQ